MKKILATSLILVVLAFGLYFMIGKIKANPPLPTITVGGKEVTVIQGSYCWSGLLNSVCADTASPFELIKHHNVKPVVVEPESQLIIDFKNEPEKDSLGANQWLSNGEVEEVLVSDNTFLLPKEEGLYVYDIFARWKKGNSSYVFVIEVEESS